MIVRLAAPLVRDDDVVLMNGRTFLALHAPVAPCNGFPARYVCTGAVPPMLVRRGARFRCAIDEDLPDGVLAVCDEAELPSSVPDVTRVARSPRATIQLDDSTVEAISHSVIRRPPAVVLMASRSLGFVLDVLFDDAVDDAYESLELAAESFGVCWHAEPPNIDDTLPDSVVAFWVGDELVASVSFEEPLDVSERRLAVALAAVTADAVAAATDAARGEDAVLVTGRVHDLWHGTVPTELVADLGDACGWPPAFDPHVEEFCDPDLPHAVLGVVRAGDIVLSIEFEDGLV